MAASAVCMDQTPFKFYVKNDHRFFLFFFSREMTIRSWAKSDKQSKHSPL